MRLSESRTRRLLKECRVVAGSGGRTLYFILYTLCFVLRALCFVLCASCEAGQERILVLPFYRFGRRLTFRSTLLQLSGLIGVQYRNMGNALSNRGLLRGDPLRPV